jgi:hypothetical protein
MAYFVPGTQYIVYQTGRHHYILGGGRSVKTGVNAAFAPARGAKPPPPGRAIAAHNRGKAIEKAKAVNIESPPSP